MVIIFGENGVAMEKKTHTHPAKPSPWKSIYLLDEYYSNPSMAEPVTDEESKKQRLVPFSVEWQMYNA